MSIPEDLSARLPTPRSDEPEALRKDIADELSDHLQCAARSEHLKERTGGPLSEEAALAAAIERFGEPSAIARQLWWDAMKERIMAQRILTIMATAATIAVLFGCFLLWQAMQQMSALQAAQITAQREAMAAMITELKSVKQSDGPQWQTLKFRLVDEDGKPAKGLINCSSSGGGMNDNMKADANGVAEFFLPAGQYSVVIRCGEFQLQLPLLLPPKSVERTIICPAAMPKIPPVSFTVDLTDWSAIAKAPQPVYYLAGLRLLSKQLGDFLWVLDGDSDTVEKNKVYWVLDYQGRIRGRVTPKYYQPETLGPNPTLTPVEGLANGNYALTLIAYVLDEPTKDAIADGATPTEAAGIPKLKLYAKSRIVESVMVDSAMPEGTVLHIQDVFFPPRRKPDSPPDPDDLPPDLFIPSKEPEQ